MAKKLHAQNAGPGKARSWCLGPHPNTPGPSHWLKDTTLQRIFYTCMVKHHGRAAGQVKQGATPRSGMQTAT